MEANNLRILLVEDNPGDVRLFRTYLDESSVLRYEITHANQLSAALEFLEKTDFDAILLDLGLPDAQGSAAFNPIHVAASHIPILILTGLEDDAIARDLVESGAQDYLFKGEISGGLLARAIRYAIERKRGEQVLQEEKARYQLLTENATDVIWVLDTETQIFTYMSPSIVRLLGFTDQEMIGRSVSQTVTPASLEFIKQATPIRIDHMLQGINEFYKDEIDVIHKDGHIVQAEINMQVLVNRVNGHIENTGIMRDITERKQMEEALQEYNSRLETAVEERTRELRETQEKLVRQERLAVLGQLAGSVGHELRNPLGVVNNAIYYLRMAHPNLEPKVKEYLGIIETEIHNADKIINDLLDFSRIKSVDVEPVIVSELVRNTLKRFPTPENVHLTLNLPENLPKTYVDPRQMTQVLGNLVLNACQAMQDGGKLAIATRQEENMIAIAINDSGVGILPENIHKIFEPLFTTKATGIGLGLAVSQKLIEANGGRIEVQSEPGKGSTFTVYLPLK